jgi:hypothetical protein
VIDIGSAADIGDLGVALADLALRIRGRSRRDIDGLREDLVEVTEGLEALIKFVGKLADAVIETNTAAVRRDAQLAERALGVDMSAVLAKLGQPIEDGQGDAEQPGSRDGANRSASEEG